MIYKKLVKKITKKFKLNKSSNNNILINEFLKKEKVSIKIRVGNERRIRYKKCSELKVLALTDLLKN